MNLRLSGKKLFKKRKALCGYNDLLIVNRYYNLLIVKFSVEIKTFLFLSHLKALFHTLPQRMLARKAAFSPYIYLPLAEGFQRNFKR